MAADTENLGPEAVKPAYIPGLACSGHEFRVADLRKSIFSPEGRDIDNTIVLSRMT